jgi:SAM-dependent MidA family methyltransferase
MLPMVSTGPESLSARLLQRVGAAIQDAGGWLPFDRFMALALYEPGLGYYANGLRVFGHMPSSGSDFVTAPELSPLFGRTLARQVAQALQAAQADEVFEFGAGSGALAAQLLQALDGLGQPVRRYSIVDLSGTLRERQAQALASWGDRVQWLSELPPQLHGVVVGNEVLDAMPVQLLHWSGTQWFERGVAWHQEALAWADRPTELRPPAPGPFVPGTVTEIHPQAEAFVRTLADRLVRGAAFFIDYGFPESEYYHLQRHGGTLMCHRAHQADTNPLVQLGLKDITAHVNFSAVALAAQDAGLDVLGYTSQGRFLLNCGITDALQGADLRTVAPAQKLLAEHEMGELFKVLALGRRFTLDPAAGGEAGLMGFTAGDRMHTL